MAGHILKGANLLAPDEKVCNLVAEFESHKAERRNDEENQKMMAYIIEAFQHYDDDDSGHLDKNEFRDLLNQTSIALGLPKLSDQFIKDMLKKYDSDKDGKISIKEFLRVRKSFQNDIIEEVFKLYDKDDSGYLNIEEFQSLQIDNSKIKIGSPINDRTFKRILDKLDRNQDGKISLKEVKKMLKPKKEDNISKRIDCIINKENHDYDESSKKEPDKNKPAKKINRNNVKSNDKDQSSKSCFCCKKKNKVQSESKAEAENESRKHLRNHSNDSSKKTEFEFQERSPKDYSTDLK